MRRYGWTLLLLVSSRLWAEELVTPAEQHFVNSFGFLAENEHDQMAEQFYPGATYHF